MTQSDLAKACNLSLSAVSKSVDALGLAGRRDKQSSAKMGWVEVRRNPNDDRSRHVYLTQQGINFVNTLEALIYDRSIQERT